MTREDLLGIEIGGTKLQVVLGDGHGAILQSLVASADTAGGGPAILRQLETMARQLLAGSERRPIALGIGFGGPVDEAAGRVVRSHQVPGWANVSLVDWAVAQFGLPCAVGNDTDVAALAEARVGAGRNDRCVFYTNIGSGIGGGLVVDGKLYLRPRGAMEIGHNWVYSPSDGKLGVLEEFCSGWSLDRRSRLAAQGDANSLMWRLAQHDLGAINAAVLFDAWRQEDAAATQVVDGFLDCYAPAIANVIALINPDVVLIGGGVAEVGEPLLGAIRRRLEPMAYPPFSGNWRLEKASLGALAVPVGALLIASDLRRSS